MCIRFLSFSGGCSTKSETSVTSENFTETILDNVFRASNSVATDIRQGNELKVNIKKMNCKVIDFNQKVSGKVEIISKITTSINLKLIDEISSKINNDIDSQAKELTSIIGQVPNAKNITNVKTIVKDVLKKTLTVDSVNSILNKYDTRNKNDVTIEELVGDKCTWSQSLIAKVQVQNILTVAMDALSSNKILKEIGNKVETKTEGKSGFLNLTATEGIVIVVILIIAAIGGLMYLRMRSNPMSAMPPEAMSALGALAAPRPMYPPMPQQQAQPQPMPQQQYQPQPMPQQQPLPQQPLPQLPQQLMQQMVQRQMK